MKHIGRTVFWAITAACCVGSGALAETMDFDDVPVGTRFGASTGYSPGALALTRDGIDMYLETFFGFGSYEAFNHVEVSDDYGAYFPTPVLAVNNISVQFDFSGLGYDVGLVTLEYMEFGGVDNFAVNGHTIYELDSLLNIPVIPAPGVTATLIAPTSVAPGVITLAGDNIDNFLIGGQELVIDTIVALPEPTTLVLFLLGGTFLVRRRSAAAPPQ